MHHLFISGGDIWLVTEYTSKLNFETTLERNFKLELGYAITIESYELGQSDKDCRSGGTVAICGPDIVNHACG